MTSRVKSIQAIVSGARGVLARPRTGMGFIRAWHHRMDALGARRGTWSELRQLLALRSTRGDRA